MTSRSKRSKFPSIEVQITADARAVSFKISSYPNISGDSKEVN